MSKRPLSPSAGSSSSSFSPPRFKQPFSRFQLLHELPASLLSQVCSFLSVYQLVSTLRSTCHELHSRVTPDCLLQSHLTMSSLSLPALAASTPSTRALISRVPSLTIVYRFEQGGEGVQSGLLPLQALRSPLDASRFLFSSLSSLRICLDRQASFPLQEKEDCLRGALQLLAVDADSLLSLRRFAIDDTLELPLVPGAGLRMPQGVPLSFSSVARLPALTECHLHLRSSRAVSCSSLVSALSSLQALTSLDLSECADGCWPSLLRLLCADAATPLLLRLRTLVLPPHWDEDNESMNALHDAFLCRLSSLPSPPALEHFSGAQCVRHRAAGLLSVFSLPHLTRLDVGGSVRRTDLSTFTSGFTSAPSAPLISLVLPEICTEPEDGDRDEAAVREDALAVDGAARTLLSRLTSLRRLHCFAQMASGVVAAPDSLSADLSGCSGSLYGLTMWGFESCCPFTAPLSFPLLTELLVNTLSTTDVELELLLTACPQLLRLWCQANSCNVALIVARCCPGLLELKVHVDLGPEQAGDAAFAAPEIGISSPFLPQLVSLDLTSATASGRSVSDFSALLPLFTAPPHAELRHVSLLGSSVTAQHVLSLACLPQLSRLQALRDNTSDGGIAEVEKAHHRARQQLFSRGAAGDADRDSHKPLTYAESCDGYLDLPPLGPHQQQEMRQRVLDEAATLLWWQDLLGSAEGVDADTVRAVFFAELRCVLSETAAS